MHKHAIICYITFTKKDKFHIINLFIQNLLIYSERQKYGINSLKIKHFISKKSLDGSILVYKNTYFKTK
jgi:hypothetical protein